MNQNPDIHVSVDNVHFSRGERHIFDGVNLTIRRGKITAIIGPSGCGKTTLLQLIGGQLRPEQGHIRVNDVNIHALSQKQLYEMRRDMGMLFQQGGLFTNLNVFENVAFPLREHTHLPDVMIHDLVLMKLESVGLRGAQSLMPSELSGGMGRRVAMARALALDPKLMMYDEPFAGQDPITMAVLVSLIQRLNRALGLTSVLVSHDVPETAHIADYIYLLGEGRIIAEGSPDQMMSNNLPQVSQFMHGFSEEAVLNHYPGIPYQEDLNV